MRPTFPPNLGVCHTVVRATDVPSSLKAPKVPLLPYMHTMGLPCKPMPALRVANRRLLVSTLRCGSTPRTSLDITQRRSLSHTPKWQIRTKEMNNESLKDLKVDQARLMKDIHNTCQWGPGERWGEYVVTRALHEHPV